MTGMETALMRRCAYLEAAEKRARYLTAVSAGLLAARGLDAVLETLVRAPLPHLAQLAVLVLGDRDEPPRVVAIAHYDADIHAVLAQHHVPLPMDPEATLGQASVIRTGASEVFSPVPRSLLLHLSARLESFGVLYRLTLAGYACVPIRGDGRVIGALAVATADPDVRYEKEELEVLEELARLGGLALDQARGLRQARELVTAGEDFVAAASHELRNPVHSLNMHLQLAHNRLGQCRSGEDAALQQVHWHVERAGERVQQMSVLLNNLLDVTRMRAGAARLELGDVDLVSVARKVVEQLEEVSLGASRRVEVVGPPSLVGRWDRFRIELLLVNLVSNALKYGDGSIEVRISDREGRVELSVHDRGKGIPAAELAMIFDRYRQGGETVGSGGVGLGLFIVRQIVELHQGEIRVENRSGGGASFVVELPRTAPSACPD